MGETLSRKVVKNGFIWSGIEVYAGQVLQFFTSVIMARLLMPSDYGTISMLTIFWCIGRMVAECGFEAAILRNKEITNQQLSTIFAVNTGVSVVLILLFWIFAPQIADFFHTPILIDVTRCMSFILLFYGIGRVSETLLRKQLKFKLLAKLTLLSALIADIAGIIFAILGFRVWALVIMTLSSAGIYAILVICYAGWMPRLRFSYKVYKSLFGFSSKMLGSNILIQLYQNIYYPIVGRFFSAATLGFFSRADAYSRRINVCVVGMIQKSTLPMISHIQDDREALVRFNRKMVCIASFFVFPIALTLAGVAYPVVSLLLTDKWLPAAPMLQILCLAVLPDLLYYINNDFFTVKGYSGTLMKVQIYRIAISIAAIICTIPLGMIAVVWGKVIASILSWIINAIYLKQVMNIRLTDTLSDLWLISTSSLLIGAANLLMFKYLDYTILNLAAALILSAAIYIGIIYLIKPSLLKLIRQI